MTTTMTTTSEAVVSTRDAAIRDCLEKASEFLEDAAVTLDLDRLIWAEAKLEEAKARIGAAAYGAAIKRVWGREPVATSLLR